MLSLFNNFKQFSNALSAIHIDAKGISDVRRCVRIKQLSEEIVELCTYNKWGVYRQWVKQIPADVQLDEVVVEFDEFSNRLQLLLKHASSSSNLCLRTQRGKLILALDFHYDPQTGEERYRHSVAVTPYKGMASDFKILPEPSEDKFIGYICHEDLSNWVNTLNAFGNFKESDELHSVLIKLEEDRLMGFTRCRSASQTHLCLSKKVSGKESHEFAVIGGLLKRLSNLSVPTETLDIYLDSIDDETYLIVKGSLGSARLTTQKPNPVDLIDFHNYNYLDDPDRVRELVENEQVHITEVGTRGVNLVALSSCFEIQNPLFASNNDLILYEPESGDRFEIVPLSDLENEDNKSIADINLLNSQGEWIALVYNFISISVLLKALLGECKQTTTTTWQVILQLYYEDVGQGLTSWVVKFTLEGNPEVWGIYIPTEIRADLLEMES